MSSVKMKKSVNKTYCSVPLCNTKGAKNPRISFHRFPVDAKQRLKWKCATRIGKPISNRMCICSKHFKKHDYFYNGLNVKRKRLKKTAVPSLNLPVTSTEAQENLQDAVQKVKASDSRRFHFVHEDMHVSDSDSYSSTPTEEVSEETSKTKPDIVYLSVANINSTDHYSEHIEQNSEDVTACFDTEVFEEVDDNVSDSNEKINSLTEMAVDSDSSDTVDCDSLYLNADKIILKEKLKEMTARYVKTHNKLKLCRQNCKHYEKQISALEKIINNFKQINSVTDDH